MVFAAVGFGPAAESTLQAKPRQRASAAADLQSQTECGSALAGWMSRLECIRVTFKSSERDIVTGNVAGRYYRRARDVNNGAGRAGGPGRGKRGPRRPW